VQPAPGEPDLRLGNRVFDRSLHQPRNDQSVSRSALGTDSGLYTTAYPLVPSERGFSWASSSTLIRLDLSPRSKAKLLNLALHWQINDDALSVDTHYTDM
jgi:hypothetical protein